MLYCWRNGGGRDPQPSSDDYSNELSLKKVARFILASLPMIPVLTVKLPLVQGIPLVLLSPIVVCWNLPFEERTSGELH